MDEVTYFDWTKKSARLSALGLRRRQCRAGRHRQVHGLVQHAKAAFEPPRPHAATGLLEHNAKTPDGCI